MPGKASKAQVKAVRKALYQPQRIAKLKDLRLQCSTIMNFNHDATLPSSDIRDPAGSGPNWFSRPSGNVDPFVLQGAALCDKIASAILAIRHGLQGVDFPAADKQHLLAALKEEAASWTARGSAWRAPGAPDVGTAVQAIHTHVMAAVAEAEHVQHYFKPNDEVFG